MTRKIVVFGSEGQLGAELSKYIESTHLISVNKKKCNISKRDQVKLIFKDLNEALIINAAAYTKVDESESNILAANKVNFEGVKNLTDLCIQKNCILFHFSTDYVFNGKKVTPYTEEDRPNPINAYGKSKLLGENYIKDNLEKYFIFRTSWVYGSFGPNFPKKIISLLTSHKEVKVINDQIGIPTSTKFLSKITKIFISHIKKDMCPPYGIYNVVPNGKSNWYEIAFFIYKYIEENNPSLLLVDEIKQISSKEFPTEAKRPSFSVLSNKKLKKNLNINMYNWETYLSDFLDDYMNNEHKK